MFPTAQARKTVGQQQPFIWCNMPAIRTNDFQRQGNNMTTLSMVWKSFIQMDAWHLAPNNRLMIEFPGAYIKPLVAYGNLTYFHICLVIYGVSVAFFPSGAWPSGQPPFQARVFASASTPRGLTVEYAAHRLRPPPGPSGRSRAFAEWGRCPHALRALRAFCMGGVSF